jgi:hypothetical protein
MKLFDDSEDVKPRSTSKSNGGESCDIFEPSVYTTPEEKYRIDYIKSITAKITAEIDAHLLAEEAPEGEEPGGDLFVTGKDPEKHLLFTFKYLRGPRGFNGSVDNFVVLSEAEYARLAVKDPNKFYYTYDSNASPGFVEDEVLILEADTVDNMVLLTTNGTVENHILTI